MGKRTSTGRRRRGWLHVRGTRPSKPLDSMAMDSSSDQRTDLTSRGLSRAGETGKTRIPRAAKAARGEAELLLEGAHQENAVGGEDKEQAQPGEGQYPAAQHQPVPHRRPGEGLGGGVDGHARPGVKVVDGGEHAHRHQKHGGKGSGQHPDVGAGEEQGGQTYRKYRQIDRRVVESGQQEGGHHQPDELTGGIERLHTGSPPSARRECRRNPGPVPGRG